MPLVLLAAAALLFGGCQTPHALVPVAGASFPEAWRTVGPTAGPPADTRLAQVRGDAVVPPAGVPGSFTIAHAELNPGGLPARSILPPPAAPADITRTAISGELPATGLPNAGLQVPPAPTPPAPLAPGRGAAPGAWAPIAGEPVTLPLRPALTAQGPVRTAAPVSPVSRAAGPVATGTRYGCPCPEYLPCWESPPCRNGYLGGAVSAIPNLGVSVHAGWVISRSESRMHALEIQGTYQPWDDEDFADDGNPAAGDWTQVRAGLKTSFAPQARRHLTLRTGAVFARADGEPNIVQDPGDYLGAYGGIGFETDITPSITVGPELSVLLMLTRDGAFEVNPVPQFSWHLTWWPGNSGRAERRAPIGELYAGVVASVSPGLGGGVSFGQVVHRTAKSTWSFETQVDLQPGTGTLFFDDDDGEFVQIRGGFKAVDKPCACGHWAARAGLTWVRGTSETTFLEEPGDYVGVYAGLGYEFDLSQRFSTGPELSLAVLAEEGTAQIEFVPRLFWHFIFKL